MVVLKYGKAKLLTGATLTFLVIPLYVALLLDPPTEHYGTIGFLAHHPRLAPMLIGVLLVFIWRAVSLAAGDAAALEATANELVLTNFWGTRHLPWRTITQVAGKTVRTRYGRFDYLVVRSVDGETKLSLGSTDMVRGALDALVATVDGLRCGALRATGGQAAPKAVPLGAGAATFDAEAVMERYLAEKGGETAAPQGGSFGARTAPAPPPQPAVPQRAAFGRKGV